VIEGILFLGGIVVGLFIAIVWLDKVVEEVTKKK